MKMELKIPIEDIAEAIAKNEDAKQYVVTYSQIANDVGLLGDQVKVEVEVEAFGQAMYNYMESDDFKQGLIDPQDYKKASIAILTLIQNLVDSHDEIEGITIVIPSMTFMGVEA